MNATELRLGNLLENVIGDTVIITSISKVGEGALLEYTRYKSKEDGFDIKKDGREEFEDSLSGFVPILLTEEWLLKFGFSQSKGKWGNDFDMPDKEGCLIMFTVGHWTDTAETSKWKNHWHVKGLINGNQLLYVHQVQNLYFALSGEELKSKEYVG